MGFRRYTLFIALMMIFALMSSSIVVVADGIDDYRVYAEQTDASYLSEPSPQSVSTPESGSTPQSNLITQTSSEPLTVAVSTESAVVNESSETIQATEATASTTATEATTAETSPAVTAPVDNTPTATVAAPAVTASAESTQTAATPVESEEQTQPSESQLAGTGSGDVIPGAPAVAAKADETTPTTAAALAGDEADMPAAEVISREGDTSGINIEKASIGLVRVSYTSAGGKDVKVMITKGGATYIYSLANNGACESYDLQMGDGTYSISIMENTRENYYRQMGKVTIIADIIDVEDVFLNAIQNVDWDDSQKAIAKAAELIKGAANDEEKVKRIYNYIINNYTFDFDKISRLTSDYLPDADSMMAARKGICYDFSSLFASMLRSVGIPVKLVMGMSSNAVGYHAWNEVYLESSNKWVIIDTTCDAQLRASGKTIKAMYKPAGSCVADKYF